MVLDLAFCMDCTGSMGAHMAECAKKVVEIVDRVQAKFVGSIVRVAFSAYRDKCDGALNAQTLDFTTAEAVKTFVGSLSASGGGDAPEDVALGLRNALKFSWSTEKRAAHMLVFVADCPAHGKRYNGGLHDDYPSAGDTEACPDRLETLMKQFVREDGRPGGLSELPFLLITIRPPSPLLSIAQATKRIDFHFLQLTDYTKIMEGRMEEAYNSVTRKRNKFNVMALSGSDPSKLLDVVVAASTMSMAGI
jgi:hypothetical protein